MLQAPVSERGTWPSRSTRRWRGRRCEAPPDEVSEELSPRNSCHRPLRMATDDDLYVRLDLKVIVGQIAVVADDNHADGIRGVRMGESQRLNGIGRKHTSLPPRGISSPGRGHTIHAGQTSSFNDGRPMSETSRREGVLSASKVSSFSREVAPRFAIRTSRRAVSFPSAPLRAVPRTICLVRRCDQARARSA